MLEEETNGGTVRLLIRCAMQSFEDTPITCPIDWTVRQLKEKLAEACSSKPEACRQRLIYAGHCLQDDRTLRSVFENRPVDSDVKVIHLVCPPRDIAEFDGIRRRKTRKEGSTHVSATSPPAASFAASPNTNIPSGAMNAWQSFTSAYGTFPMPGYANSNAQLRSAYNAYIMSYTNYMQQMIVAMGGNMALANGQPFMALQAPFPTTAPMAQPAQPAAAVAADVVAAPAAGGIIQEAVAGDVDAPQRDFLDIVYKARRDRNNRQRADRELAHAVNNVRHAQQQVQREDTDSDTGSSDSEVGASESNANADENREPTAWTIFWSTCYTFITSFFTSLIPDNPVPVNVN